MLFEAYTYAALTRWDQAEADSYNDARKYRRRQFAHYYYIVTRIHGHGTITSTSTFTLNIIIRILRDMSSDKNFI